MSLKFLLTKAFVLLAVFALYGQQPIDSTYTVPPPPGYIVAWDAGEEGEEVISSASDVIEQANRLNFDTASALLLDELPTVHDFDFIPTVSDETIKARLDFLEQEVPLNFHPRVRVFIDFFSVRKRGFTLRIMQRKNVYFPMFEEKLKAHGVPEELKYLSIIESALIPTARSRVGAMGLWQFMPYTGRIYGVKRYRGIDERCDPEKSTEAAARYLKDLYEMFGDWELAIAAYNCGPGNVRKAQRRAGAKKFWDIYHRLPRETRSYLPQFVAMTYVLNYAEEHNLYQDKPFYAMPTEEVAIETSFDLGKLAQGIRVCQDDLEDLNPQFTSSYIYVSGKPVAVKIPSSRVEFFVENRKEILEEAKVKSNSNLYASNNSSGSIPSNTNKYYYTVRSGDVLGAIAQRNGVGLSSLRAWNNIYTNRIYPGQKLVIYRKSPPVQKAASTATGSSGQTRPASASAAVVKPKAGEKVYYTVKRGDVLGSICQRYNVGLSDMRSWNNLKGDAIYAGQKLVIYGAGKTSTASKPAAGGATGKYHIVKEGETLWGISQKYEGLTVEKLKSLNNLKSSSLKAGQKLKIG